MATYGSDIMTSGGKDFASSTASSSTASYLIPRTLFKELMMAVKRELVLSSLAARRIGPAGCPGSTFTATLQTPESIGVNQVDQGGEVPLGHELYSQITCTPVKYGVRITVPQEVVEDSTWDVVGMSIESAGQAFAINEESLIVAQLDAASTAASHDVANSNATLPVTDITEAIQNLRADNYNPTDMVIGVEVENDMYNIDTFTEADKSGVNNPTNRLIGRVAGMNIIVSNSVSAKLAYVIDRRHAFLIVDKRPITISKFFNATRDMAEAVVTQRVGVTYIRANAVSEITTL